MEKNGLVIRFDRIIKVEIERK